MLNRRRAATLAGTLGVLIGLFGMHVLGLHGIHHDAAPAMVSSATHSHATAHGSNTTASQADADPAPGAARASECCDHGQGMGALMSCLALLVGSIVLAALVSRRARGTLTLPRVPRLDACFAFWRARAGPPYAMAFSVVRC